MAGGTLEISLKIPESRGKKSLLIVGFFNQEEELSRNLKGFLLHNIDQNLTTCPPQQKSAEGDTVAIGGLDGS
jgi:hypothetical protein